MSNLFTTNPFSTTNYLTLSDLDSHFTSQNNDGTINYNSTSASAEHDAFMSYLKTSKATQVTETVFQDFVKSEKSTFGRHFALGKFAVPKLAVYGVGGVAFWMFFLK